MVSFSFQTSFLSALFNTHVKNVLVDPGSVVFSFKKIYFGTYGKNCVYGSIWDRFDGLVDTPDVFAKQVRLNRRSKKHSEFVNSDDFYAIPVFPVNWWDMDGDDRTTLSFLNESIVKNSSLSGLTCLDAVTHDQRVIGLSHQVMNFTQQDLIILQSLLQSNLQANWSFINQVLSHTFLPTNESLWNSTCYMCTSESCIKEYLDEMWFEYFNFAIFAAVLLYYVVLFASGAWKQPYIKFRMGVSYVIPLIILITDVFFMRFLQECIMVSMIIACYGFTTFLMIYIVTVVRYFYMKNLYNFIKGSRIPKFHKWIASKRMGYFLSFVFPFSFGFLLVIVQIGVFSIEDSSLTTAITNYSLSILLIVSCGLGLIYLCIEMKRYRAVISGGTRAFLIKFFFVEDAFYARFDLFFLSAILLLYLGVVISSFFSNSALIVILRMLGAFLAMLIAGGNAMIIKGVQWLMNRNKPKAIETSDQYLSLMQGDQMVGKDLYELFTEYARQEFSLENVLLFEVLRQWKLQEGTISLEELTKMESEFLTPYSMYEVNVSNVVRNNCVDLIDDLISGTKSHCEFKDLEPLMNAVIMNIRDTFDRFERTQAFEEWNYVYNLQKMQSLV